MLEKFEGVTSPQESTETMQEITSINFGIWNSTLQTGNLKEVVALYIVCHFLPTVSGELKKGQYGEEEYFKHSLDKIL